MQSSGQAHRGRKPVLRLIPGHAGKGAGYFPRHLDFKQVGQGLVHRGKVLLDNRFAALAIGFLDGFLIW